MAFAVKDTFVKVLVCLPSFFYACTHFYAAKVTVYALVLSTSKATCIKQLIRINSASKAFTLQSTQSLYRKVPQGRRAVRESASPPPPRPRAPGKYL